MIVVSDTSPLNYLLLTDLEWILPRLFGTVVVPDAVYRELRSSGAPERVRRWLEASPPWLLVRPAPPVARELLSLDAGEREVIALAEHTSAGLLLLDEARGRRVASSRRLAVAGTLGVLERAATRGLIDLVEAIDRLRRTNFRASANSSNPCVTALEDDDRRAADRGAVAWKISLVPLYVKQRRGANPVAARPLVPFIPPWCDSRRSGPQEQKEQEQSMHPARPVLSSAPCGGATTKGKREHPAERRHRPAAEKMSAAFFWSINPG